METKQIAQTIWDQISSSTKMACGARDAKYGEEDGLVYLIFRVTIKRGVSHFVKVIYELDDTYTVKLIAVRGEEAKIVEAEKDIYCDNILEVIYGMCNK